jgi:hypothetical protein
LFIKNHGKLSHYSSSAKALGGVWRRLTVRFNTEGDVLVVLQASPAGAAGGAAEVTEEVNKALLCLASL